MNIETTYKQRTYKSIIKNFLIQLKQLK